MNINNKITRLTDEIRNDKTQGASQLARHAMAVLKFAAEHSQADSVEQLLEELKGVGEGLTAARPAMASIFNIVNRYMGALSPVSPDQGVAYFKSLAVSKADELARVSLQAIAEITSCGLGLIAEGDKIMTHSYSSTVVLLTASAPTRWRWRRKKPRSPSMCFARRSSSTTG